MKTTIRFGLATLVIAILVVAAIVFLAPRSKTEPHRDRPLPRLKTVLESWGHLSSPTMGARR